MSSDLTLISIELNGFKSFGKRSELRFGTPIVSIVGPNGSGKSNIAEAFRFVLGEQSMRSMRSKRGEDLIWGGTPGLARGNRASVKVTFNNARRLLDIDFPEVIIERVVYRDGQNEYLLNGSIVRLKDIMQLLFGAHIGGSGYQIISQGEADRILNSSPRERREMVEDALGLKLYQSKKIESERKLQETIQNIEKTRSLRRELAPHVTYLRDQVEKIEKARELRDELTVKLSDYLAREHAYIQYQHSQIDDRARRLTMAIAEYESQISVLPAPDAQADTSKIATCEQTIRDIQSEIARIERELGRAEGAREARQVTVEHVITAPIVRSFVRDIESRLTDIQTIYRVDEIHRLVHEIKEHMEAFVVGLSGTAPETSAEFDTHITELTSVLSVTRGKLEEAQTMLGNARTEYENARRTTAESERTRLTIQSDLRTTRSALQSLDTTRSSILMLKTRFEDEVREGIALIGAAVHSWDASDIPEGALAEDRSAQERRRREIERLKIKIEEAGIGNADEVIREYTNTKERDEFLARELVDLERSIESLNTIIDELETTINTTFTEGLGLINTALQTFFSQLFSGGDAKLTIERSRRRAGSEDDEAVQDEEEQESGLGISVSLPRKKVSGLEVLSGGERALTSIALIFAMSQVNPPPFLILDETDAALDEANSKRYADMIRELGRKSQLIVISHNRATMAAAGELFGITMGHDGVSKLLSIKLEEAVRTAK